MIDMVNVLLFILSMIAIALTIVIVIGFIVLARRRNADSFETAGDNQLKKTRRIRGTVATDLPEGSYFAGYANPEKHGLSDSSEHLKNFKKSIKK